MSDPNFADVSLLLHMDGADGSTTFTDSSSDARTISAVGNAQLDTAIKKFGSASGLFDGSGDYLSTANSSALVNFSTALTIECFIYPTLINATTQVIFSTRTTAGANDGISVRLQGTNQIRAFGFNSNSVRFDFTSAVNAVTLNAWQHIALTRTSGGVWNLWVNGSSVGSATETGAVSQGDTVFRIGETVGNAFYGNIDEVRVTNGVARYTSAFTPPTAAFPDSAGGPTITSQPANESVSVGDTAEFTVAATGAGTLSYQWKNGADDTSISGATSATYSFTAALPDNGKTYYCTVTDDDGSIDSNTVTLTVSASSTYTPTLADANKVLRFTAASPEVTIPTNASVAFPVGTILTIRQAGTGTLTLVTTGLTINGTVPSWAQHVEVQFRKVGTNEWDVT